MLYEVILATEGTGAVGTRVRLFLSMGSNVSLQVFQSFETSLTEVEGTNVQLSGLAEALIDSTHSFTHGIVLFAHRNRVQ